MSNFAAIIPAPKAPLEVREVEKYTPGPTELLVRNEVVAFNAVEYKIAIDGTIPVEYPATLGSTFGGTIEAIGSQVTDFQVGDRIAVSKGFGVKGNQYGAHQRYVVVGDVMASKIPDSIDLAVPASLMMNLTCVVGLFTGRLGLERPNLDGAAVQVKDTKILIYGGSSSFGGLSVKYLSQAGYKVVTTSSPKNHAFVSKLGAAMIVDHTSGSDKIVDALVTEGPYDVVVDMISMADTLAMTGRVLERQGGGKLYTMQPGPESLPEGVERLFEPWSSSLYEDANKALREWVLRTYIPQGLLQGDIPTLPIEKVEGGLGGINRALKRMHDGLSGLKLVGNPWE